ncbi:MAG: nucleotidyltransferase family protein [Pseudomonas sp.]|nr:nucleotidyltransferase family protein [Pseudomonas sp.]
MKPCAVVLAAGEGRRFRQAAGSGQNKLLALCRGLDGIERPVIEQVLFSLQGVAERILVVTRPGPVAQLALACGCEVLAFDSSGMGESIAGAVAACADEAGWLMVLGDMPFIRPDTFRAVVAASSESVIAVPEAQAGYGHPVAFGKAFGPALMALQGDQGARKLLAPEVVRVVAVSDPGIYWDVDVPERLVFQ